ncbi:hypothetical protein T4E_1216 [Trichinella pseudospiralis]|uniref:Uncharacterized protein n=1 Tax=Trichinella pseudospiralis TaxID=6337 RepID=A0A0V0X7U9_TRIPS|nr:hypothetical protein T4E_1216 [Trichinella pseudospiralis]
MFEKYSILVPDYLPDSNEDILETCDGHWLRNMSFGSLSRG